MVTTVNSALIVHHDIIIILTLGFRRWCMACARGGGGGGRVGRWSIRLRYDEKDAIVVAFDPKATDESLKEAMAGALGLPIGSFSLRDVSWSLEAGRYR